jgi:hypothetical protein
MFTATRRLRRAPADAGRSAAHFMEAVKDIRLMWDEWKGIPFPSDCGDKDVAGTCLTTLDTFTAGCIDTFIANNGRLDKRQISVLERCKNDLEAVVSCLDGAAQNYFNALLVLAKRVLQSCGH